MSETPFTDRIEKRKRERIAAEGGEITPEQAKTIKVLEEEVRKKEKAQKEQKK